MSEDFLLNQITQFINGPMNLSTRDQVLQVLALWERWKKGFLKEQKPISRDKMGMDLYDVETQLARDKILVLNFWPWGGSLESIVASTGKDEILKHWRRCIAIAHEEAAKQAKQSVA